MTPTGQTDNAAAASRNAIARMPIIWRRMRCYQLAFCRLPVKDPSPDQPSVGARRGLGEGDRRKSPFPRCPRFLRCPLTPGPSPRRGEAQNTGRSSDRSSMSIQRTNSASSPPVNSRGCAPRLLSVTGILLARNCATSRAVAAACGDFSAGGHVDGQAVQGIALRRLAHGRGVDHRRGARGTAGRGTPAGRPTCRRFPGRRPPPAPRPRGTSSRPAGSTCRRAALFGFQPLASPAWGTARIRS